MRDIRDVTVGEIRQAGLRLKYAGRFYVFVYLEDELIGLFKWEVAEDVLRALVKTINLLSREVEEWEREYKDEFSKINLF